MPTITTFGGFGGPHEPLPAHPSGVGNPQEDCGPARARGGVPGDIRQAQLAHTAGAHLITFPEMVLTGYPVEDLALRSTFRQASKKAIAEIAPQLPPDLVAIIGYLDESADGKPQNAVALIHQGKILATYIKHHLPNYGVFDEFRNFVAGTKSLVFRLHGIDIGVAICEDIWRFEGPVAELAARLAASLCLLELCP